MFSKKDIADGNIKLVLGFIWMLILHYQIAKVHVKEEEAPAPTEQKGEEAPKKPAPKEDPKALLLARVNKFLSDHDLAAHHVSNFIEDWQNGMAFCALAYGGDKSLLDLPSYSGNYSFVLFLFLFLFLNS